MSTTLAADALDRSRSSDAPPLLVATGIRRFFGETAALVDGSLSVREGEVHALLGENGSGKSTLIKIISGVIRSQGGELRYEGRPLRPHRPADAQRVGILTVFQETLVAAELSVLDNVFLGTDGFLRKGADIGEEVRRATEVLERFGFNTSNLDRPLWTCSLAERQIVTIARSLIRPWRLLILDEPTSALDHEGRERLFEQLREYATAGRAVVLTTHRMDEVESIATTATVLRAGATVGTLGRSDIRRQQILELMSPAAAAGGGGGGGGGAPAPSVRPEATPLSETVVLQAREVVLREGKAPVSLELHEGEILGLAGLEGQGEVAFLECVGGLRRPVSGEVLLGGGADAAPVGSFAHAYRQGVVFVPRDRKTEGLFHAQSVLDNLSLPIYGRFSRAGIIRRRRLVRWLNQFMQAVKLSSGRLRDPVGSLSGGNQQKVLLGRWLATQPRVLLLNDPLRGVDATTKQQLYELLHDLATSGLSILFLSTEIAELLTLCERIAVFNDQSLEAVLVGPERTEQAVIDAMFGRGVAAQQGQP